MQLYLGPVLSLIYKSHENWCKLMAVPPREIFWSKFCCVQLLLCWKICKESVQGNRRACLHDCKYYWHASSNIFICLQFIFSALLFAIALSNHLYCQSMYVNNQRQACTILYIQIQFQIHMAVLFRSVLVARINSLHALRSRKETSGISCGGCSWCMLASETDLPVFHT